MQQVHRVRRTRRQVSDWLETDCGAQLALLKPSPAHMHCWLPRGKTFGAYLIRMPKELLHEPQNQTSICFNCSFFKITSLSTANPDHPHTVISGRLYFVEHLSFQLESQFRQIYHVITYPRCSSLCSSRCNSHRPGHLPNPRFRPSLHLRQCQGRSSRRDSRYHRSLQERFVLGEDQSRCRSVS
jgi:hypothetical protein